MARYQRKPEFVDAIKYNGTNVDEVAAFFGNYSHKHYWPQKNGIGFLEMRGERGYIFATPGDMIVKSAGGQIVSVKAPDFFEVFEIITEGNA